MSGELVEMTEMLARNAFIESPVIKKFARGDFEITVEEACALAAQILHFKCYPKEVQYFADQIEGKPTHVQSIITDAMRQSKRLWDDDED